MLGSILNPDETAGAIFGLASSAVPDQDADGYPDFLVVGLRGLDPPPSDPNAAPFEWRWWVMSQATGGAIRLGVGEVGSVGCAFLDPGPPLESPLAYWESHLIAGDHWVLPGLAGDLDADGDVDEGDAGSLINEWGDGPGAGPPEPGESPVWRLGDLDQDGVVGASDLQLLLEQFGLVIADEGGPVGDPPDENRSLHNFNGSLPGLPSCVFFPEGCPAQCPYIFCRFGSQIAFGPPDPGGGGDNGCPNCPPPCPPYCPPPPPPPPPCPTCQPGETWQGVGCTQVCNNVSVQVSLADWSSDGHASWVLWIGPHRIETTLDPFVPVVVETIELDPARSYEIRLERSGSTHPAPTLYGYRATILGTNWEFVGGIWTTTAGGGCTQVAVNDLDDLFGTFPDVDSSEVSQKRAHLTCFHVDIDTDSNNDGLVNAIDDEQAEQSLQYSKLIFANRYDLDRDGVPDFADGFGMFGESTDVGTLGNRFAPLPLCLSAPPDARVRFVYPDSRPELMARHTVDVPDIESEIVWYGGGDGGLRIWKKNGDQPRTVHDFVPSDVEFEIHEFAPAAMFYVEAVEGSDYPYNITIEVLDAFGQVIGSDSLRILGFDPREGFWPEMSTLEGFEIVRDSGTGTPGRDIIFAPPGVSEIRGFEGDDIIVAPAGDMTIDAGDGEDVVFASLLGEKRIFHEGSGSSAASARGGDGEERVEALEDAPLTNASVRRAYELIYGVDDPWLDYFERARGTVRGVAYTLVPPGELDVWCERDAPGEEGKKVTITFGLHLASPFQVATAVREKILELAGRGSDDPCGLRVQMEGVMGDAIAFGSARDQVHEDPDAPIESYEALRQAAIDDARAGAVAISNIYLASLGFVSEGADIVLTIGDLTEGKYIAAVGLLPFVSAPMVSAAKVTVKVAGAPVLRVVDRVVVHFPGVPGVSDLGWVIRQDMPMRFGQEIPGGRPTVILGTGQWTNGDNGFAHAAKCEQIAQHWSSLGGFEYVVMNRSLHTCTGRDTLGSFAGKRPDVFGVKRGADGNPIIFIREIRSPSQLPDEMEANVNAIEQALRDAGFDNIDIDWIDFPY